MQVFKTRPGTLLIDRTKYASGVPGEYMYESYGIHLYEHAATIKLLACSYQRKDCCHGSENSSATRPHAAPSTRAARLRDGRSEASAVLKAFYYCTLKFKCGRSFEHPKLRLYLSLPKTILSASLQLHLLLRCSYNCCFAATVLESSVQSLRSLIALETPTLTHP